MKKNWKLSIYSDGSKNFVSNPCPVQGEKITISIQMLSSSPVNAVFLMAKYNGVEHAKKMKISQTRGGISIYQTEVQVFGKEFNYLFYITTNDSLFYYNQLGLSTFNPTDSHNFRILIDYKMAEWVKNAVFYQIFPDRFYNGNPENDVKNGEYSFDGFDVQKIENWETPPENYEKAHCLDFYGGDLEGIRQKIPYLKKLGITALYINPIFYGYTVHKYDCIDYFKIDPHFGGEKALAELTDELHKNGIKIILDISINHTGCENKWFKEAINNKSSEERKYYFIDDNNNYKAWFDVATLPTLNYTSKELCDIIFNKEDSLVKKWLKPPFNTDGWRFDVAETMARNNELQLHHQIWPEIRNAIKETKSDSYILAEDWSDSTEFLNGNEWDSAMNYYGSCRPIRKFIGQDDIFLGRDEEFRKIKYKMTAKDLHNHISGYLSRLPFVIQQNQFNLLDSHDVPRLHNDKNLSLQSIKGAITMIFTLPGCTNIYYGDEAFIDGTLDSMEGCRYPMPWGKNIENLESFSFYSKLCKIKNSSDCFKDGGFKILYDEGYILSYARFTNDEVYIFVFSQEEKNKKIKLPVYIFGDNFVKNQKICFDELGEKIKTRIFDGNLELFTEKQKSYLIKLKKAD